MSEQIQRPLSGEWLVNVSPGILQLIQRAGATNQEYFKITEVFKYLMKYIQLCSPPLCDTNNPSMVICRGDLMEQVLRVKAFHMSQLRDYVLPHLKLYRKESDPQLVQATVSQGVQETALQSHKTRLSLNVQGLSLQPQQTAVPVCFQRSASQPPQTLTSNLQSSTTQPQQTILHSCLQGSVSQLQQTTLHSCLQKSASQPQQIALHSCLHRSASQPQQTTLHSCLHRSASQPQQTTLHSCLQRSSSQPQQTTLHSCLQSSISQPQQTTLHSCLQRSVSQPQQTALPSYLQKSAHIQRGVRESEMETVHSTQSSFVKESHATANSQVWCMVQPKLQEVLNSMGISKSLFTVSEVLNCIHKYIIEKQKSLFDPQNKKVALCENDPLGEALGVRAFHYSQARQLVLRQLLFCNRNINAQSVVKAEKEQSSGKQEDSENVDLGRKSKGRIESNNIIVSAENSIPASHSSWASVSSRCTSHPGVTISNNVTTAKRQVQIGKHQLCDDDEPWVKCARFDSSSDVLEDFSKNPSSDNLCHPLSSSTKDAVPKDRVVCDKFSHFPLSSSPCTCIYNVSPYIYSNPLYVTANVVPNVSLQRSLSSVPKSSLLHVPSNSLSYCPSSGSLTSSCSLSQVLPSSLSHASFSFIVSHGSSNRLSQTSPSSLSHNSSSSSLSHSSKPPSSLSHNSSSSSLSHGSSYSFSQAPPNSLSHNSSSSLSHVSSNSLSQAPPSTSSHNSPGNLSYSSCISLPHTSPNSLLQPSCNNLPGPSSNSSCIVFSRSFPCASSSRLLPDLLQQEPHTPVIFPQSSPLHFDIPSAMLYESSGEETVYSVQGYETAFCQDSVDEVWSSDDTDTDLKRKSTEDVSMVSLPSDAMPNDSDIVFWGDSESEAELNLTDPRVETEYTWYCIGCGRRNKPFFTFCQDCWQLKKDLYPPTRKKRRRKKRKPDIHKSLSDIGRTFSLCYGDSSSQMFSRQVSQSSTTGSSFQSEDCLFPFASGKETLLCSASNSSQDKNKSVAVNKGTFVNASVKNGSVLQRSSKVKTDCSVNITLQSLSPLKSDLPPTVNQYTRLEKQLGVKLSKIPIFSMERLHVGRETSAKCIRCQKEPKNASILHGRVGHQVTCYTCGTDMWKNKERCPVCNRTIQKVVKNFFM